MIPDDMILRVLAMGAAGLVVSLLATRTMIGIAIMDRPNHRSSHKVATPRSGGVAIILGFLVTLAGCVLVLPELVLPWPLIGTFLASAALLSTVSLLDDIRGVSAGWKFGSQLLAGVILVAGGFRIEALSLLRYVSESRNCFEATGRAQEIKAFLSKPPLSGEEVLAQRVAALTSLKENHP